MATPPSTPPLSDLRYALAWLAAIGATALAAATLLYFQNRTVNDYALSGKFSFQPGSLHRARDLYDGASWIVVSAPKEFPASTRDALVEALREGTRGVYSYASPEDFSADAALWRKLDLTVNNFGVVLLGRAASALGRLPDVPIYLLVVDPKTPAPHTRLEGNLDFCVIFVGAATPEPIQRSWIEHAALYRGRVKRTTLASLPTEIETTLALLRQGRTPTPEGMGDYLQTRK